MTAVVDFYQGHPNPHGRTLAATLALDDAQIEAAPDTIAWLFPLPEPTPDAPGAPLLTDGDIAAFHDSPALHTALERSLTRIRSFYGLPSNKARHAHWVAAGSPHLARLARILRSLHLLGLEHEALALLRDLESLHKAGAGTLIGAEMLARWRRAAQ